MVDGSGCGIAEAHGCKGKKEVSDKVVEVRNKMIGWWYWLQKCKRLLKNKVKGLVEVVEKDINTIINELVARNIVS